MTVDRAGVVGRDGLACNLGTLGGDIGTIDGVMGALGGGAGQVGGDGIGSPGPSDYGGGMSPTVLRRVQIGLLTVGVIITVMMATMVAGAYRNDVLINSDKATTVAEVTSAGPTKASVAFSTPDGMFHSPRLGVFYPGGLTKGQRISIDYSKSDPELVRVTGRGASLAILPALSVLVYSWLVIGGIMVLLAEINRRRSDGRSSAVPDPVTASKAV